jgi:hypothetical protein
MIPTYNYSIHMYSWVVSQPTFTSRLGAPHCSFIKLVFSVRKKKQPGWMGNPRTKWMFWGDNYEWWISNCHVWVPVVTRWLLNLMVGYGCLWIFMVYHFLDERLSKLHGEPVCESDVSLAYSIIIGTQRTNGRKGQWSAIILEDLIGPFILGGDVIVEWPGWSQLRLWPVYACLSSEAGWNLAWWNGETW